MYDYKRKNLNTKRELDFILAKTLSMFRYEGLPETLPKRDFEKQLQLKGYAFITEFEGELYSFTDGLGGEPDPYGNPTTITIANPALKFNKTLNLKEDGVLVRNDSMQAGIKNLLEKYIVMMNENEISMVMNSYLSRMPALFSAGDDATRESAIEYLKQVVDGELGIVAENQLFDGIKTQAVGGQGSNYTQLIEYQQYLKATLYNELGLEMNNNMKRERLTEDEVNMVDVIYPFVDNMMMNRLEGIEKLNAKYDTDIKVNYDSVWAKHEEQNDDEFLSEVDMYLQDMYSQDEQQQDPFGELFGDTTDEDLQNLLDELLELDELILEEDEEVLDDGDNDDGRDDSDTSSASRNEASIGNEPEGETSRRDIESSGEYRADDTRPDDDNTRQSDEHSGAIESDVAETSDSDDTETDGTNDKGDTSGDDRERKQSVEDSTDDIRRDAGVEFADDRTDTDELATDSDGTSTSDTSGGTGADSTATDEGEQETGTTDTVDTSTPTIDTSTSELSEDGIQIDIEVNVEGDEVDETKTEISVVEDEVEVLEVEPDEPEYVEPDEPDVEGDTLIGIESAGDDTTGAVELEVYEVEDEPVEETVLIVEEPDTVIIVEEDDEDEEGEDDES